MQEERLAAEEAAHAATEEAIRKAEVQAAQKAKEAGYAKQTLSKSLQANLPRTYQYGAFATLCFCRDVLIGLVLDFESFG